MRRAGPAADSADSFVTVCPRCLSSLIETNVAFSPRFLADKLGVEPLAACIGPE